MRSPLASLLLLLLLSGALPADGAKVRCPPDVADPVLSADTWHRIGVAGVLSTCSYIINLQDLNYNQTYLNCINAGGNEAHPVVEWALDRKKVRSMNSPYTHSCSKQKGVPL